MWVKTYGKKMVNLDSISMIDTTEPLHNGGSWHVTAWFVGEDCSVPLHVGTFEQCTLYMELLTEFISSIKAGVFTFTVTQ